MTSRPILPAFAVLLALGGPLPASGQTLQYCNSLAARGDYQAGIDCIQRLQRTDRDEMTRREQAITRQAMQDPDCQARYASFRARGGQLPYEQFAYLYAATRGFTPEGIAYFQQTEARNHANEMAAWQGVLSAEAARGQAQRDRSAHFDDNQFGAGLGLQGRGEYVDPTSNRPVTLQNTRPNVPTRDAATGQWYVMDERGTYYVQAPGGQWLPMRPGR